MLNPKMNFCYQPEQNMKALNSLPTMIFVFFFHRHICFFLPGEALCTFYLKDISFDGSGSSQSETCAIFFLFCTIIWNLDIYFRIEHRVREQKEKHSRYHIGVLNHQSKFLKPLKHQLEGIKLGTLLPRIVVFFHLKYFLNG